MGNRFLSMTEREICNEMGWNGYEVEELSSHYLRHVYGYPPKDNLHPMEHFRIYIAKVARVIEGAKRAQSKEA